MKDVLMPGETMSVSIGLEAGEMMPTGTGAQTLSVAGADSEWRNINEAPRDGTVIELQNNYGVAPCFGIYKWVNARGWVDATDENMGVSDGPHLSWRPFDGDPTVYVDPTGGAQNTNEYWLQACGMSAHRPQPRQAGPSQFEMVDISAETFGKYQYCTMYQDRWYADSDFPLDGTGMPKDGAVPNPRDHPNATPFERPTARNRIRRFLKLFGA